MPHAELAAVSSRVPEVVAETVAAASAAGAGGGSYYSPMIPLELSKEGPTKADEAPPAAAAEEPAVGEVVAVAPPADAPEGGGALV